MAYRSSGGYVSVDIDIDDVLSGMNRHQLQDLADSLYDDGYTPTKVQHLENVSVPESFYQEAIRKLANNYHQLTKSEEEVVMAIAKRF